MSPATGACEGSSGHCQWTYTLLPSPDIPSLAGVDSAGAERRVQEVLDLLHLHACADTIVGNDLLRGISGGEKKRVTVGEGLITNARFLALDEISTGAYGGGVEVCTPTSCLC